MFCTQERDEDPAKNIHLIYFILSTKRKKREDNNDNGAMLPARHKDCDVTVKFYTTRSLSYSDHFPIARFQKQRTRYNTILKFWWKKKKLPVDLLSSYFFLVNYHFYSSLHRCFLPTEPGFEL